jgi:RNA polymerase sigma factor (sigma-70 family)
MIPTNVECFADNNDYRQRRLSEDREVLWQAARYVLTDRQHEIIRLSLEGWSVAEMAQRLQLPPQRVSDEKYKAIHKLQTWIGQSPDAHA